MQELHANPECNWEQLRPIIDEAMDELSGPERDAVLLRFFEYLPLADVDAKFSISADAGAWPALGAQSAAAKSPL
jgi:DNA-directed RNA polymerase specialized sigma24 family protein